MARLADNNGYVKINGVVLNTYMVEFQISHSSGEIDVTAGFGQTYTQREPGLKDTSLSGMIAYEVGEVDTYLSSIASGQKVEVEYGPEGAVSGKPRHVQEFVLSALDGINKRVTKDFVVFSLSGNGADTPTVDMFNNGTYA